MKRFLLLFLAGLLLFASVCVSFAQADEALPEEDAAAEEIPALVFDYDKLTVAATTPLTGNFLWGNSVSDLDVRGLIHGLSPVFWQNEDGVFTTDETVVSGMVATRDADGNETFIIALYSDLYYCDGTRITAKDYAFSILLSMAPEIAEAGGKVLAPRYILGYDAYINGEVPYLSGLRVLSDTQYSVTISADYLPYFYELGLLDCNPYPIRVILPDVEVVDDGRGVYLKSNDPAKPAVSVETLRRTLMDPVNGYMTHPTVTSGPYRMVSYENGVAKFEYNPYFKGDAHGMVPRIRELTFKTMENPDLIPAFSAGEVQLINKVTYGETIQEGLSAIRANNQQLTSTNYPRTGLSYISFNAERPIVEEPEIRQAIAYQIDKDALVRETVGNYGLRVDGYYGLGQWMYQLITGVMAVPQKDAAEDDPLAQLEYEKELEEWAKLSMDDVPVYDKDTETAENKLKDAGWIYDAQGAAYQFGIRYKVIDGELVPLHLTLAYPETTPLAERLEALSAELAEIGIELSVFPIPAADLFEQYYGNRTREYDMFFLTSNFNLLFDPAAEFITDSEGHHIWEETGIRDERLYEYAKEMSRTEPGDLLAYCRRWLEFQKRFQQTVPMIPLYSNVYFDFYPRILRDYDISSNYSWSQAIVPAYLSDAEEEIEEEGAEEEEGDILIEIGD